jgi:hypothetical protein
MGTGVPLSPAWRRKETDRSSGKINAGNRIARGIETKRKTPRPEKIGLRNPSGNKYPLMGARSV